MVKMVVVDGIRYRPEDAPAQGRTSGEKAAPAPRNKARQAAAKEAKGDGPRADPQPE